MNKAERPMTAEERHYFRADGRIRFDGVAPWWALSEVLENRGAKLAYLLLGGGIVFEDGLKIWHWENLERRFPTKTGICPEADLWFFSYERSNDSDAERLEAWRKNAELERELTAVMLAPADADG